MSVTQHNCNSESLSDTIEVKRRGGIFSSLGVTQSTLVAQGKSKRMVHRSVKTKYIQEYSENTDFGEIGPVSIFPPWGVSSVATICVF